MSYMKSEHNRGLVNRFHLELLDKGDLTVADEILAPNFGAHVPGAPSAWLDGIAGVKQAVVVLRDAFGEFRVSDREDTVTKGGKVAVRWVLTARHNGDFLGVKATGRDITITGINVFRIEPSGPSGKIVELRVSWDRLGLMQQLGAPAEMSAAAAT